MKSLVLTIVGLLLSAVAYAGTGDAGRESPFSIGNGARALAMGGGVISLSQDASAVYYNPAGLANLLQQEVSFTHVVLFANSTYDFASWVYPVDENRGFGLGFMRIGTGDIVRRAEYADKGTFSYSQSQLVLSYGLNIGEPFAAGTSLKIVNQALDDHSDFAIEMDLGATAKLYKHLSLGAIARDILPTELQLDSTAEDMPFTFAGGLTLHDLSLSEHAVVTLSGDLEKHADRAVKLHAGGELTLHRHYAFRAGYDRDNMALGAGLLHGRLKIDYAYKVTDYVEDVHHFTVSFLLGKSVPEQKRLRELALRPPEPTPEEKLFASLMAQGNSFLQRFELDSAATYYRQALDLRPNDQEIIGSLAAIAESRRVQHEQEARLRQAETERNQTITSFVTQAESLYDRKIYQASLDLLNLVFDIDANNLRAEQLRSNILQARAAEVEQQLLNAKQASDEGRFAEAIEGYNRVLEIEPDNKLAPAAKKQVLATMDLPEKIRAGIELFEKGRLNAARTQFNAVLEVNPSQATALDYLSRIGEAQTRTATLEDLQKDRDAWALYLDGLRYMRNKEYQKAIDAWNQVLKAYPNNPNTVDNIEQAKLRLGSQEPDR